MVNPSEGNTTPLDTGAAPHHTQAFERVAELHQVRTAIRNFDLFGSHLPTSIWTIIAQPFNMDQRNALLDSFDIIKTAFVSEQVYAKEILEIFANLLTIPADDWKKNNWRNLQQQLYQEIADTLPVWRDLLQDASTDREIRLILQLYCYLLNVHPASQMIVKDELKNLVGFITNRIETFLDPSDTRNIIAEMFLVGDLFNAADKDTAQEIAASVEKVTSQKPDAFEAWIADLFFQDSGRADQLLKKELAKVLPADGLTPSQVIDIWQRNIDKSNKFLTMENISLNIEAIHFLEIFAPGSTKHLAENWGIMMFGRYPLDVLLDMYEADQSPHEKPYVFMLSAQTDNNGALYMGPTLQLLHEQLIVEGYALKIIECGSLKDIIRYSARLRTHFGKAAAAIIDAHGSIDRMQIGYKKAVSAKELFVDVEGKLLHRGIRRLFRDQKPQIIFLSCSVGKAGAIAEQIADKYDLEIVAPTEDISCESLSATVVDGKLELDVEYSIQAAKRVLR